MENNPLHEVFLDEVADIYNAEQQLLKALPRMAKGMEENEGEPTIDDVLIAAAQKVEHYEIASYGTVAAWATLMGHHEAADLFHQTLSEEKAADQKLTQIAETAANAEAEDQQDV